MSECMAIIPARSGSKGVIDKNIRPMDGKPMMAYSISHALASSSIDRVLVTTDSSEYAEIAREYGAEVPFLRPAEISGDHSTDLEAFRHALLWLREHEGDVPETVVHLRPTHPVRDVSDIDQMVEILKTHPELDSVRSVSPVAFTPFKMWFRSEKGVLSQVVDCDLPEPYNQPRQMLPQVYQQNAAIDVVRSTVILEQNSMTGKAIHGYRMHHDFDIDSEEEFLRAEQYLKWQRKSLEGESLRFVVDIDGVIASIVPVSDYSKAGPLTENIRLVNQLYEQGHEIILFTARGYVTGMDWRHVTEQQLQEWAVKYHELHFGKPNADFYIDDKLISLTAIGNFLHLTPPTKEMV